MNTQNSCIFKFIASRQFYFYPQYVLSSAYASVINKSLRLLHFFNPCSFIESNTLYLDNPVNPPTDQMESYLPESGKCASNKPITIKAGIVMIISIQLLNILFSSVIYALFPALIILRPNLFR